MPFQLSYIRHNLQFKFDARTSRGSLTSHTAYYLLLSKAKNKAVTGWGEAAPLEGLSIDYRPDFEEKITQLCQTLNARNHSVFSKQILDEVPEPFRA